MNQEKQNQVYLHFEFADGEKTITPVIFTQPKEIIVANKVEEVYQALERVQEAVDSGFYAAGYVAYEAAAAFHPTYNTINSNLHQPLVWFGIFDRITNQSLHSRMDYRLSNWIPNISKQVYKEKFSTIQQHLRKKATNQVNYTIRMHAHFEGDAFSFYEQLKRAQAANYTCYVQTEEHHIVSASPELFFRIKEGKVITRPMAGTAKRGKTHEEDKKNREALRQSEKNKVENKLIVDLLCKDLEHVAKKGTVKIPQLYEIEQYPTVFQMTSTVTADLKTDSHLTDIFQALFPSASMTGDPKDKTMEIIREVETSPRGVYSGAIGYITPQQEAVFNVPIRTVVIHDETGHAEYGVGGGITINSTSDDEYDEILTKAAVLKDKRSTFQLLESMRLENGEYFLFEEHLNRLVNSSQYFKIPIEMKYIINVLDDYAKKHTVGVQKVRLLVSETGSVQVEGEEISLAKSTSRPVTLATSPIMKENIFLYHKTTNRSVYENHKVTEQDIYDTLLWNEENELTEFTNGNLVVEWGGSYYTPPVSCGLLPGTFRSYLLKEQIIEEKILKKNDLGKFTRIWFINSVRKWVPIHIIGL